MEDDPLLAADGLVSAFGEMTKALNRVKGRTRTLSILLAVLTLLVVAVVAGGVAIYRVQQTACESGNTVRAGLLDIADTLEAAQLAPRADGRERTAEEIATAAAFVADLRDDFALRDC